MRKRPRGLCSPLLSRRHAVTTQPETRACANLAVGHTVSDTMKKPVRSFRLPDELMKRLRFLAKLQRRTASALAEILLEEGVEREEKKQTRERGA